ncbi:hypothetical protein, partial [Marseilla massiliensis]|uniref:hypothetical protein n=1 Tax=Marseilla massiliensis TaxID=1841864 RepID=UPI00195F9FD6
FSTIKVQNFCEITNFLSYFIIPNSSINFRNGGNILAPFLNLNLSIQVLVYHPVIVLGRHGELFDVL